MSLVKAMGQEQEDKHRRDGWKYLVWSELREVDRQRPEDTNTVALKSNGTLGSWEKIQDSRKRKTHFTEQIWGAIT